MKRKHRVAGYVCTCADCRVLLMMRSHGLLGGAYDLEWFMVKDRVWHTAQRGDTHVRYLCVGCLETRIGRKLTASDFKRSVKINFVGHKTARLRKRMRGLQPATRLRNTVFTP
jgi:hypothetical protein